MLGKKMEKALNEQLNAELYSSYLYASMSAYFASLNLPGFANWMRVQALEEETHAARFYDFINARNGRVLLKPVEGPPAEWASPLAVFEESYKHEIKVTGLINNLVTMALEEKDYATREFLQWFVSEQVEEEASADAIARKLKLIGKDGTGLLMLDQELAARTFNWVNILTGQPAGGQTQAAP